MKRILSLTIICMIPLFAFAKVKGYPTIYSEYKEDAQREHPDKEPDKIVTNYWLSYYHTENGEFGKMEYYALLADTIIGTNSYMKVIVEGKDTLFFRQEGDKVFLFHEGQELLLIDYGLKEGDSFVSPWGERFVVTRSFTFDTYTKYYGSWHKCSSLYSGNDSPKVVHLQSLEDEGREDEWMEGLGSVEWGIIPLQVLQKLSLFPAKAERIHLIHGSSKDMYARFEVIEEDYAMIPFDPTPSLYDYSRSYTFSGDTLCVNDYWQLNRETCCAECTIKDYVVSLKVYSESGATDMGPKRFQLKIPGLKAGTYKIFMNGALRREALVCKGADGIESIQNSCSDDLRKRHYFADAERTIHNEADAIYDLSGRRVENPKRGLYIQGGKKVVKQK